MRRTNSGGSRGRAGSMTPAEPLLPLRDGVGASCIALPPGPWPTAFAFLVERFPRVPVAEWQARMARGDVVDERGAAVSATQSYQAHARLFYYRHLPAEPDVPFAETVLFQDDHLVVIDKPHFLPVTPGGRYLQHTVLVRARNRLGIDTLAPLHRLDRETAGLVVLGVRPEDRPAYHAMFRERAVEKVYEAVARFRDDLVLPCVRRSRLEESPASFMQMHEVAGECNAETAIECLGRLPGGRAHYRLRPRTGQRPQLRVHLAALGLPIEGDLIYPVLQPHRADGDPTDFARPLQLLARSIAFTDPVTGEHRIFESRLGLSGAGFGHDAQAITLTKEKFRDL